MLLHFLIPINALLVLCLGKTRLLVQIRLEYPLLTLPNTDTCVNGPGPWVIVFDSSLQHLARINI